mmetsp:Transcript_44147/g.53032  ORF Transcript_44147/g.53032 Transcript_44147/m.53032 type:complete len:287 (+) Transcript_44147:577-1437(+)
METLKTYMGNTKKSRKMKINALIQRAKTLNNYLPQMNTAAAKLTEREMLKLVVLKIILTSWALDLRRAKNHNKVTLVELPNVLKPIEEAEETESMFKHEQSSKGKKDKNHNDLEKKRGTGNSCRKPGHNHEWSKCPDNYANKRNESNAQERLEGTGASRAQDSSKERLTVNYEDQELNFMDFSDTEDEYESNDSMPSLVERGESSNDELEDNNESNNNTKMSSNNSMPGLVANVESSGDESGDDESEDDRKMPGLTTGQGESSQDKPEDNHVSDNNKEVYSDNSMP